MVKLRKTSDRSASSMVVEPPYGLNGTEPDPYHPKWRHMKYEKSFLKYYCSDAVTADSLAART